MRTRLKKDFMFLFNLVLFLQLYSYHKFEVEANQRDSLVNCVESYHQNGSTIDEKDKGSLQRPKRPARLMPVQLLINEDDDETPTTKIIIDKRFYGPANNCSEIAKLGYTLNGYYLVKGNATRNSQIQVLGCKFKHFNRSKEVKEEKIGFIDIEIKLNKAVQRRSIQSTMETEQVTITDYLYKQKRPARLLPLRMILGEEKNKTGDWNAAETRFYGPATSCDELGKLGYTLNGLYLVDCQDKSNIGRIEVIICTFKQPNGSKEVKEERFGFIKIDVKTPKTVKRRTLRLLTKANRFPGNGNFHGLGKRPVRLLPPHLFYGKEKSDETEDMNAVKRFYDLPSNCNELGLLGYTLNGFYLVNGTNNRKIEIVLCRFQQPVRENVVKEERFDLVTTTTSKKPDQFEVPIYRANTTFGLQTYKTMPLDSAFETGKSFFLINNHGKCLTPEKYHFVYKGGQKLIQRVCDTTPDGDNELGWYLRKGDRYGDGIRLVYMFDCVSFGEYSKGLSKYAELFDHAWGGCNNINWKALVLENGIQFSLGNNCLAIEGDSAESESFAILTVCDLKQKGQIWSFVEFEK